ncbi:MAG TPA: hypothetical protein VFS15_16050, partial [Kofleriaceae bacterium]|nr:hypothetical protein [Kofleriaceae bacterium]
VAREVAQQQDEGSGSAVATNPEGSGSATGSDISATGSDGSAAGMVPDGSGSATAMVQDGSGSGSAGSATETVPAAVVDTVITASLPKNAMVEIAGTDQKGAAPLVAKLEKDKAYTAKVSAPGFVTKEIEIKGGQAKVTAKLAPKQRIITITTDPPGAAIYIDGVDTERISPADVQLTASQALRPRVRVSLRRPGFRPVDQILDVKKFQESDARMTASINAKLAVAQRPTGTDAGTNGGSGHTGSGSATTPGGDTGSESTPSGGGTGGSGTTAPSGGGTSAPSGGATTAPGAGASNTPSSTATPTASNGEPEPTWAK